MVLLSHSPVDPLAEQVGVPAVTGMLLDPVHHELSHCDPALAQPLVQIRMLCQRGVGRGLLARAAYAASTLSCSPIALSKSASRSP